MTIASTASSTPFSGHSIGWLGIVRLGLVQAALGSMVVMATSTMNRVMVVELALPAMLPGFLVALHYVVQVLRPRFGWGSDQGGRRTPWIVGGMAVLATGTVLASTAIALMSTEFMLGLGLAIVAFLLIGAGVGAAGTCLLVLLSKQVAPNRRAAAATITWVMMLIGFIVTSVIAGKNLDPFTFTRLVEVTFGVSAIALLVTVFAVRGVEGAATAEPDLATMPRSNLEVSFRNALIQVWNEPQSRRLASFVFFSMIAYSAQDLILEPFAGSVFGLTPGETTQLSGVQNGGVLVGMVVVALFGSGVAGPKFGSLRAWTIGGCIASAIALLSLAVAGLVGPAWPLRQSVFILGVANGVFAIGALASMMSLVSVGRAAREGVRMGLWGAAQAIAFAIGGLLGTILADVARWLLGSPAAAYGSVFVIEAIFFIVACTLVPKLDALRSSQTAVGESGVLRTT